MNKLANNIVNKINQQTKCCAFCGKSYIKQFNLDKHVILCELIYKASKKKDFNHPEDVEEAPSNKKMYLMLLELGSRFAQLEQKMDDIGKWVVKKKKHINVVEWLNTSFVPEFVFDKLIEKIIVLDEDIQMLMNHGFVETLHNIFGRTIYIVAEQVVYPIFAFVQKSNVFYIYENEEQKWCELSRERLTKFLNYVFIKISRAYSAYKKAHAAQIEDDERFSLLCDKTSVKLMAVDFSQDITLGKIKTAMYMRMKTDMKGVVEYEFEF